MKKYFILTAVLMVFAVFITSCDKDGVYNPKQKISKIYHESDGSKILHESWSWDGNLLTKISYGNTQDYYDLFEYEKKQMVKMTSFEYGIAGDYTTFIYDKSLLQKAEVYSDKELTESMEFEHDGKKIIKVTITSYQDYDYGTQKSVNHQKLLNHTLRLFVSQSIIDKMVQNTHKSSSYVMTIEFTYDGNNVISEKLIEEDFTYMTSYTYDDKDNPFYDALFGGGDSHSSAMSQNNPLTAIDSYSMEGEPVSSKITYTYVYDGTFPTEQKATSSYMEQEYSYTTYFEYVK